MISLKSHGCWYAMTTVAATPMIAGQQARPTPVRMPARGATIYDAPGVFERQIKYILS